MMFDYGVCTTFTMGLSISPVFHSVLWVGIMDILYIHTAVRILLTLDINILASGD